MTSSGAGFLSTRLPRNTTTRVNNIQYACVPQGTTSEMAYAVAMANDSAYGLSGYVFGKDTRKAVEVACRLRTGTVNVNGSSLSPFISSGGWGRSGIGRERGEEGLRMYQEIQVLNITN